MQRELTKLAAVSLVTVRRQGNQKHYQANAAAPIYDELRGLVLKTFGLGDVLRAALRYGMSFPDATIFAMWASTKAISMWTSGWSWT